MSGDVRYHLQEVQDGYVILKDFRDGMVPARPYATFIPNADHPREHKRLAHLVCHMLNEDWRKQQASKPRNQESPS